MSAIAEQLIDHAVAVLNEAVAVDPRLWALFDVMVPCANIVGHCTRIELMGVNESLAMANTLGLLNGILSDANCRISIIVENSNGITRRVFAKTATTPHTEGSGDSDGAAVSARETTIRHFQV